MADRPKLANPVVHVTMADGAEHHVVASNGDMVAFDLTRGPRKWPLPADAPILYQTFLAWRALTRENLIDPKTPWDVFVRDAVQVITTRPDADGQLVQDTADVDLFPAGSRARLIIELAVATNTAPRHWWDEPDQVIVTALDVLAAANERIERADRAGRGERGRGSAGG